MRPEISIIVPVYNVESYIEKCVDSILNQDFKNFELILINDGSTDNSGQICEIYKEKDNRVIVIHQEYKGVSVARNIGVKNAKGSYIGFVDSDDYIYRDMYSTLYNLCKETNSDIGVCKLFREIDGEIINLEEDLIIKEMNNEEAMKELFKGVLYRFSLANKLFKKSCFDDVQFPEGRIHEDLSTTYRLFANSKRAIYTNSTGYVYVKRSNSILTSIYSEKRLQAFLGWNEIIPFMKSKYKSLIDEVITCFSYSCIDNIHYILNQVNDKSEQKKLLKMLNLYVKKYYKDMFRSGKLVIKQKILLTIFRYNTSLLLILR